MQVRSTTMSTHMASSRLTMYPLSENQLPSVPRAAVLHQTFLYKLLALRPLNVLLLSGSRVSTSDPQPVGFHCIRPAQLLLYLFVIA